MAKINEIWEQVSIAPDYYISSHGNIKSYKNNSVRLLKTHTEQNKYVGIALCVNGKYIRKRVHQLVALAFVPNPNNYNEVNHIDCNKSNNHHSNLEWCDHTHNIRHAFKNGLVTRLKGEQSKISGGKNPNAKLVLNTETGIYYDNIREAAKTHNLKRTTLNAMLTGRRKNKTSFCYA